MSWLLIYSSVCSYHGLCVTNTFFQTNPQHRVSWRYPRSKRWHQLDMIIVRHISLKHVLLTRTCHSADCDMDHSLVCCKIRLRPKTLHRAKPQGKPLINTTKRYQELKIEEFAKTFEEAISTKNPQSTGSDTWIQLRECNSYVSTSHLRKEDLPELWLARCKVLRDDPCHRSQTGGTCWI